MNVKFAVHVLSSLMLCGMLVTLACAAAVDTEANVDYARKGNDDAPEGNVDEEAKVERNAVNEDNVNQEEEVADNGKDVDPLDEDDDVSEVDVNVVEEEVEDTEEEEGVPKEDMEERAEVEDTHQRETVSNKKMEERRKVNEILEEEEEKEDAEDDDDEYEDEDEEAVYEIKKLDHDWKEALGELYGEREKNEKDNDEKKENENNDWEERHDKIFGGTNTNVSQFPYIVSVQLLDEHYCAGSLIKVDWVLTAAHCLVNVYLPELPAIPVRDYSVIAGQTDVMNPVNLTTSKHDVFANYPNQMYVERLNVSHDIGLMHLKTPFELTPTIQLTKRPPLLAFDRLTPQLCTVVGWSSNAPRQHTTLGKMYKEKGAFLNDIDDIPKSIHTVADPLYVDAEATELSSQVYPATVGHADQPMGDVLNYIVTRPVGYNECQQMVSATRPHVYLLKGTVMCASDLERGKDTCQGDAGGPVVCNGFQMGVTSWSFGCDRGGLAGVYTRVDYYLEWMDAVMSTAPDVRGDRWPRGRRRLEWESSAASKMAGNVVGFFTVFVSSFLLMIVIK